MPGVRQFDQDAVLDRAAGQFWRAGYEATSIQDLEAATGLGRGSLYNAFGGKEALFVAVLERYGATQASAPFSHLADDDVRRGVAATLDAIFAAMTDPARPHGCLIVNTCASARPPAVDRAVATALAAMEAAFHAALLRGRSDGQLPPSADARALARFYAAIVQSLALMSRAGAEPATLKDVVTVAMSAWPEPDGRAQPCRNA